MGILRYDKKRGTGYVSPWDAFDDMGWWLGSPTSTLSWDSKREWVDTERYDIVPKKEYRKVLIENKQKEIESLLKEKERLEEELKELKRDL
jgi:hypothetical protein